MNASIACHARPGAVARGVAPARGILVLGGHADRTHRLLAPALRAGGSSCCCRPPDRPFRSDSLRRCAVDELVRTDAERAAIARCGGSPTASTARCERHSVRRLPDRRAGRPGPGDPPSTVRCCSSRASCTTWSLRHGRPPSDAPYVTDSRDLAESPRSPGVTTGAPNAPRSAGEAVEQHHARGRSGGEARRPSSCAGPTWPTSSGTGSAHWALAGRSSPSSRPSFPARGSGHTSPRRSSGSCNGGRGRSRASSSPSPGRRRPGARPGPGAPRAPG
jgi:hypothetical protein